MKTIQIVALMQALNAVQALDRDLPRKLNYALDINRKRILPLAETYDKQVGEIVQKFAQRDERGEMVQADNPMAGIKIDQSRSQEYVEEMKALHDTEVEVSLHLIDLDMIPESFPARHFAGLAPLIREPNSGAVPLRAIQGDG